MTEPLRSPNHDVHSIFPDRWSPRSYSPEPLANSQIDALLEAARWAPSCFNEQPWHFIVASNEESRLRFVNLLTEKNQLWARSAPLILFIMSRLHFSQSGTMNRHAPFDSGSAWMSLALQARALGLHAHAMAGFDRQRAYLELSVDPEKYDLLVAVVVGRRDPKKEKLPDNLRDLEVPNHRRPVEEIVSFDRFSASCLRGERSK